MNVEENKDIHLHMSLAGWMPKNTYLPVVGVVGSDDDPTMVLLSSLLSLSLSDFFDFFFFFLRSNIAFNSSSYSMKKGRSICQ